MDALSSSFLRVAGLVGGLFCVGVEMRAAEPEDAAGTPELTLVSGTKAFPDPAALPIRADWPDPLMTLLGQPVRTPDDWRKERAPELRRLFQHYMYGWLPPKPATFATRVLREEKAALGGKATLRETEVRCTGPEIRAHLLVVIPNRRTGPAPVFLGINFNGNHTLLADPQIELPQTWMPASKPGFAVDHQATDAARGSESEAWAIEQTIDRGYAFAGFYHGDFVPDEAALAEAKLREFGHPAEAPAGAFPATIACWAWGFSRMIDYLVTDPDLDPSRIAVVGHSRNGKTALLAAALDERIALAIPSQAGCGGSAPSRLTPELAVSASGGRPIAETVGVITKNFPHWFCGNFAAFAAATDKLPFDQHCLIALCAPRPVLLSNAVEDRWANPAGQFDMLRRANPVYQLIAGEGLGAETLPETGALLASRLGYYIRPGQHSMTGADWKVWLDYADVWLKSGRANAGCCDSVRVDAPAARLPE